MDKPLRANSERTSALLRKGMLGFSIESICLHLCTYMLFIVNFLGQHKMRDQMSFGSRLRQERDRLGLTQQKFAELGGVKRVSQHLYEQDVRVPNMTYLMQLKEGGVDVWFLINGARLTTSMSGALSRSVYVSAFRAIDELARDGDGHSLPLAERERLFDILLTVLQSEQSSAGLDEIKSRLSGALVA